VFSEHKIHIVPLLFRWWQAGCATGESSTGYKAGKVEFKMADRKQFQNVPAPDPELMRLLEASRHRVVTEEELREQRVSFAFGNAPRSELITKESVRAASTHIRLMAK
jgi:hypothetical protein